MYMLFSLEMVNCLEHKCHKPKNCRIEKVMYMHKNYFRLHYKHNTTETIQDIVSVILSQTIIPIICAAVFI